MAGGWEEFDISEPPRRTQRRPRESPRHSATGSESRRVPGLGRAERGRGEEDDDFVDDVEVVGGVVRGSSLVDREVGGGGDVRKEYEVEMLEREVARRDRELEVACDALQRAYAEVSGVEGLDGIASGLRRGLEEVASSRAAESRRFARESVLGAGRRSLVGVGGVGELREARDAVSRALSGGDGLEVAESASHLIAMLHPGVFDPSPSPPEALATWLGVLEGVRMPSGTKKELEEAAAVAARAWHAERMAAALSKTALQAKLRSKSRPSSRPRPKTHPKPSLLAPTPVSHRNVQRAAALLESTTKATLPLLPDSPAKTTMEASILQAIDLLQPHE